MTDEDRLRALVAAVADGTPVDWQRAESGAQSDEERAIVRQLRLIATLSDVSRTDEGTRTSEAGEPRAGLLTSAPMPEQWGPLHLRELVGSGGYGTVYRAWDPQLAREVALKLLNADRAADPSFEQSVIAEGRRLARLRHPNVIDVYGADTHEGRVGFWMEFLEGQTLKQWVDVHGPMGSREATFIGIDLCRALAAVHAAGLVHRDVKAQNVMRGPKGRTVLMDFGTGVETGEVTRLAGTPLYMAPELLAGGPPTPNSDLYSVGALLFYLVSGEFPVTGPSFAHIKAAHAAGSRRTVRDVRPDLPAAFVKVVDRALSSDPAARPPTAGALEAELAASLELPVETTPPPVPMPGPGRTGPGYTVMGIAASAALLGALWASGTLPWVGVRSHEAISASRVRSLAVLPLENLSGAGQDYFSDGMTDLLTTNLSKLGALRVIARGSVMGYKGGHAAPREIASALNVDAVIQGSVQRDGNRIRITAQLVSGSDQSTLWADTYVRDIRDAFTLQSDLARDIARGINLSLTPKEQAGLQASAVAPRNVQAQDEYLKGWTALEPRNASAVADALTHFENAVRIDPAYAQAFASIAYAYSQEATLAKMSGEEAYGRAREAAMRALDLDSSQSAAYYALGLVQFNHDWDWAAASSSFQHAIDLDPGNADAHSQYGEFLTAQGRFTQALAEMRRAREIDPMNHVRRSSVAMVLFYMGRYPEAEAELRQILAISKKMGVAKFMLGRVYAVQGRTDEALAMFSEPDAPQEARNLCERARVLAVVGRVGEARQLLRQIEGSPESERILDGLAFVYAALGQHDTAMGLLNRAVDARLPTALWITVDPRFAPLHADPRFAMLLRRIGLQQE
jgi:serine/threonine protein kinase/tetratricopeptide (TPR) repeat protein